MHTAAITKINNKRNITREDDIPTEVIIRMTSLLDKLMMPNTQLQQHLPKTSTRSYSPPSRQVSDITLDIYFDDSETDVGANNDDVVEIAQEKSLHNRRFGQRQQHVTASTTASKSSTDAIRSINSHWNYPPKKTNLSDNDDEQHNNKIVSTTPSGTSQSSHESVCCRSTHYNTATSYNNKNNNNNKNNTKNNNNRIIESSIDSIFRCSNDSKNPAPKKPIRQLSTKCLDEPE
jgi:hypothetical protein